MSPRVYLCIAIFCVLGALGLTVSEFVANKFMPATTFDVGAKFSLINHQGAPVTESVFQGHPSALFFGFTHCPEVCPTTLNDLALAKQELGPNDKLKVYFITLDPLRDTSDVLAEYIPYFGPDFMGITGSEADIQALSKSWGIYSQRSELSDGGYNIDHTATVFCWIARASLQGQSPMAKHRILLSKN